MSKNAFYAQSGGVTAVINSSAAGVIQACQESPQIEKIFIGKNGILGALNEEMFDATDMSSNDLTKLKKTPAGAFGSCRYKLKSIEENKEEYTRLVEVFRAHDIKYFFYNGGGDSQDTAHKVSQISLEMNFPITCIGIPKTIDNDLPYTDCCPGFGSVAKYVATSTLEASLDVKSMAKTSTKVFILEVMGRHAGWIAASSALCPIDAPHVILFPEIAFDEEVFLQRVKNQVEQNGYCTIVASEGVQDEHGNFLSASGAKDAFGHAQLGGVASTLATMIKNELGFKYHYAVADYLQRSAGHIVSKVDQQQAFELGKHAVEIAINGMNAKMPIIKRTSSNPYNYEMAYVDLEDVANVEKKMPRDYITDCGFGITKQCFSYLAPLIAGESYPEYVDGLPDYYQVDLELTTKKL